MLGEHVLTLNTEVVLPVPVVTLDAFDASIFADRQAAWQHVLHHLDSLGIDPQESLFRGTDFDRISRMLLRPTRGLDRPIDCYTFLEMEECMEIGYKDSLAYAADHYASVLAVLDAEDFQRTFGYQYEHTGVFPARDSIQALFKIADLSRPNYEYESIVSVL